jgi:glycosyltransferase involved in cell wall biosynthesis
MRRILAVHPSDELYGADRVLLQSVQVLERLGRVRVWLPDDVEYAERLLTRELSRAAVQVERPGVVVLRREYARLSALPSLLAQSWRTFRALRRERPDLVYVNTSAMLLVAPLARLVGARVLVHVHEGWTRRERLLLGPLLRTSHAVLAVSEAVAKELPLRRGRIQVVHNGVDVPEVPEERRAEIRALAGAGEDDTLVLVASRWNRWKGVDVLLEAWSRLEREDLRLVVLGGPPPSGQAVDVKGIVERMPHRESVTVVGEVDHVAEWFAASDLIAVPSIAPDPFPLVAVEAAAHGVAVLASRTGGLPEMVVDRRTGVLLEPGDVQAWAEALASSDPGALRAMGRAAAEHHRTDYTGSAFSRRLAAAVQGVLRSR